VQRGLSPIAELLVILLHYVIHLGYLELYIIYRYKIIYNVGLKSVTINI